MPKIDIRNIDLEDLPEPKKEKIYISDYDDNDDLLPDHNVVELLFKFPYLSGAVASHWYGHGAGDDHGEITFIEHIALPVSLVVGGLALLVIGPGKSFARGTMYGN